MFSLSLMNTARVSLLLAEVTSAWLSHHADAGPNMREATALACALVLALACAQAQRAELCAEEAEPPAIVNNLDMQAFSDVQSVFNTANLTLIRTGRLRPVRTPKAFSYFLPDLLNRRTQMPMLAAAALQ